MVSGGKMFQIDTRLKLGGKAGFVVAPIKKFSCNKIVNLKIFEKQKFGLLNLTLCQTVALPRSF